MTSPTTPFVATLRFVEFTGRNVVMADTKKVRYWLKLGEFQKLLLDNEKHGTHSGVLWFYGTFITKGKARLTYVVEE